MNYKKELRKTRIKLGKKCKRKGCNKCKAYDCLITDLANIELKMIKKEEEKKK